ncbi:MAG: glutathione synthase [Deltaproteobacteria bacterium]|nr:MAG: glutathione synthase [Deltaproteobacteria bacterium]
MILSYHPCFIGDENRLCAGRRPDQTDLDIIRKAAAVILPQGCTRALYQMARENSPRVFPNYDARFAYPDKTGQIRLFEAAGFPHPFSLVFENSIACRSAIRRGKLPGGLVFPIVFKYAWGGEGQTVNLIQNMHDLERQLVSAAVFEKSGQSGFLLQTFIPTGGRVLRVVRIGDISVSYWRVADHPDRFPVNLAAGSIVDHDTDPDKQKAAVEMVDQIHRRAGINLAGFDFIFPVNTPEALPLLLEINYFFGRSGLGGSEAYYDLLIDQIRKWIQ